MGFKVAVLGALLAFSSVSVAVLLESHNLTELPTRARGPGPFILAVEIDSETAPYATAIESTVRAFVAQLNSRHIAVQRLTRAEIVERVREGRVDLLLTTASLFTQTNAFRPVLFPIASLWPRNAPSPTEVEGAVYFTRATNNSARRVEDLNRQTLALTSATSFAGWYVAKRDILRRGYAPSVFFEKVTFYGDNPLKVVREVAASHAYAGVLPSGAFEALVASGQIRASDFRFIEAKKTSKNGVVSSTDCYPSLYLSRTESVDLRRANLVREVLRSPLISEAGFRWAPPASDRAVYDLFFDLKIGPYEQPGRWTFGEFFKENRIAVLSVAILFVLIVLYSTIVSYAVRKKTLQLRLALREREKIEREATVARDRITNLERAGMIGQMSTMIAHELKQPIGAINNFAHGMLRRVRRDQIDKDILINILEEIVNQGTRASDIVNRVRSYAKQKTPTLVTSDLSVTVERAIENFRRSHRGTAPVITDISPYLWAEIDDWEIELAVLNLLKNANDSVKDMLDAEIRVRVFQCEQFWRIQVSDNGPKVSQEYVDHFMMLFMTTKESGLGLGLSLVSTIAERHNGRLIGRANPTRGVTLSLDVPRSSIEPADV